MCGERRRGLSEGVASEGMSYTKRGVQRLAYFRR